MTRSGRIAWVAAAAVLVLAPASAGAAVPTLNWQDCGDGIQCATANVPLDHDSPNGTQIQLAVARLPASDPSQRIGTLFINPGGPGGSGIAQVRSFQKGGPTNQRFDIVGFDPRGVGVSRPAIECVGDSLLDRLFASIPAARPRNLGAFLRGGDQFAAGCRRHTPKALLNHVSTADAARDMDLLRQAVGDPKLTYLGFSYGTELGAVYATLFPDNVRAMALDGGVNHNKWFRDPLGYSATFAAGNEKALGRFFAFCKTNPGRCPFAKGNARKSYDALLRRLDRKPLPGTSSDRRKTDGTIARGATLAAMYDPAAWGPLAQGLKLAQDGNGAVLKVINDAFTERDPSGHYSNFLEANAVITANDSVGPTSRRAFARHLRRLAKVAPHFAELSMPLDVPGRTLPVGQDAYRKPLRYPGSAPILMVVGSTGDNATTYTDTRALARQLGNTRLLTRQGNGHTAFGFSSCVAGHVRAYLFDGTLPPAGTVCPTDPR